MLGQGHIAAIHPPRTTTIEGRRHAVPTDPPRNVFDDVFCWDAHLAAQGHKAKFGLTSVCQVHGVLSERIPIGAARVGRALREAREEIGLDPRDVRILGQLPHHETVTGFSMTPVLGALERLPDLTPDPAEVAEVFTVPFAFATNLQNFRIEGRIWQGQMRRFYTVPYGPYYIWGATARVLFGLAKRLAT